MHTWLVAADGQAMFNHAAQAFNHELYWHSMVPNGGGDPPSGEFREALVASFGSMSAFRDQFAKQAKTHFGSGWTWLVQDKDGNLRIVSRLFFRFLGVCACG